MRLSFFFICISFIVSARKMKDYTSKSVSDESIEPAPFASTILDLRGTVRRDFALEAAFVDDARNMICSPVSVLMPLGKILLGAERRTERELLRAVGLSSRKQVQSAFAQMITNLQYLPGVTLDVASRVYVFSEKDINRSFLRKTKEVFQSTCQRMSSKDPIRAAKLINEWVADKTRNKIKQLITPNDIQRDTSVVLVNAIYFAGNWKDPFEKVYLDDFHAPTGVRRVPMMMRQGQYNYWECDTLNAQVIEIPYEGEHAAMIIVLPYSRSGLPVLLRALKLAPELLNGALEKMKTANVILSMPKFKIETELDLGRLWPKIGITSIFSRTKSGLTRILNNERVYVSKAIHKAVIEVNEKGTEAAAATGLHVVPLSSSLNSPIFRADRPFIFYVTITKEQLFSGIYSG